MLEFVKTDRKRDNRSKYNAKNSESALESLNMTLNVIFRGSFKERLLIWYRRDLQLQ